MMQSAGGAAANRMTAIRILLHDLAPIMRRCLPGLLWRAMEVKRVPPASTHAFYLPSEAKDEPNPRPSPSVEYVVGAKMSTSTYHHR